jgi:hypothetical protein
LVVGHVVVARPRHVRGLFGLFEPAANAKRNVGFGAAQFLCPRPGHLEFGLVLAITADACGESRPVGNETLAVLTARAQFLFGLVVHAYALVMSE